MNYQYNQQPQQQMPQQQMPPPAYVNAQEVKKRRKEDLERFADKMANFCKGNPVLSAVSGFSDILAFIIAGVCLLMNILLFSIGRLPIYEPLAIAAIVFGVLALSKKSVLPLAVSLSVVAVTKLLSLIFTIINLADIGATLAFLYSGVAVMYVFQLIFIVMELAVVALPAAIAWQYFIAALPPKAYPAPMYNNQMPPQGGQMPQQNYQQPAQSFQQPAQNYQQPAQSFQQPAQNYQQPAQSFQQPAQNYQQPPVQNYQQPDQSFQQPAQNFQQPDQSFQQAPPPAQPQAPAGKQCPGCGTVNSPEATFCRSCGKQI
ncbi:MAG: hypothetical protein J1F60_07095 [Oscillospiraceae bacterium]|nr:hypothetical protein [Oscillospiraceae bacterium]